MENMLDIDRERGFIAGRLAAIEIINKCSCFKYVYNVDTWVHNAITYREMETKISESVENKIER